MINNILEDRNLSEIYVFEFKNGNSCDINTLQNVCDYELKQLSSINEITLSNDILTVVCGSFYMLKELLSDSI